MAASSLSLAVARYFRKGPDRFSNGGALELEVEGSLFIADDAHNEGLGPGTGSSEENVEVLRFSKANGERGFVPDPRLISFLQLLHPSPRLHERKKSSRPDHSSGGGRGVWLAAVR